MTRKLINAFKRVSGKENLVFQIAEASLAEPISCVLGLPAIRHIVSFTSVIVIASSTVTKPSTEASMRPRL